MTKYRLSLSLFLVVKVTEERHIRLTATLSRNKEVLVTARDVEVTDAKIVTGEDDKGLKLTRG